MFINLEAVNFDNLSFQDKVINNSISIHAKTVEKSFDWEFIVDTIIECQDSGMMPREWICKNSWMCAKKVTPDYMGLLGHNRSEFRTVAFICPSIIGKDMEDYQDPIIRIIPESPEEYEYFFKQYFKESYPSEEVVPYNGLLLLPKDEAFMDEDLVSPKIIGNTYVTIPVFNRGVFETAELYSYCLVLQIKDLRRPVVKVFAPSWIIKHLIGKSGRRVMKLKDALAEMGYDKIKRIKFISTNGSPYYAQCKIGLYM